MVIPGWSSGNPGFSRNNEVPNFASRHSGYYRLPLTTDLISSLAMVERALDRLAIEMDNACSRNG
jgi:hypothetical protein